MRKHFLAFAANFKNENRYLKEWLDYHILVGVDHFYLYDQDGGEETRNILDPYEKQGFVTRHLWTQWDGTKYDGATKFYQKNKNHMGFSHCAKHHRDEFQWLMKIDVDEFLYPMNNEESLVTWLHTVNINKVKGCRIPRINFGSNGHEITPMAGVLEAYTKREDQYSDHKDLANSIFLNNNNLAFSAHWWHYKWWKFGTLLKVNIGWRINHYYIKSKEEYLMRQNVSNGRPRTVEGFISKNIKCNDITDEGMLKFSSRLLQ